MPVDRGNVRSLDVEQSRHPSVRSENSQGDDREQRGRSDDDLALPDFRRMRPTPSPSSATHLFPLSPDDYCSKPIHGTTGPMINRLIAVACLRGNRRWRRPGPDRIGRFAAGTLPLDLAESEIDGFVFWTRFGANHMPEIWRVAAYRRGAAERSVRGRRRGPRAGSS